MCLISLQASVTKYLYTSSAQAWFIAGIFVLLAPSPPCSTVLINQTQSACVQSVTKYLQIPAQAWFIAGIFVLLALPVSIYEVAMHLEYFTRPRLQIHVIRILWMVPIYALDSWFALRFSVSETHLVVCHDMPFTRSTAGSRSASV